MKTKIFNFLVISSLLILLIEVLSHKLLIFDTIAYSLKIWINNLVPSMFPIFVLSDMLVHYQLINYLPQSIKKIISHLFNVSEQAITVFFLAALSGFPTNARIVRNLYDNQQITASEAAKILTFTHFSNPVFILTTVATIFFNQEQYGYLLLLSHYLGNIILGIIFKNYQTIPSLNYTKKKSKSQNFSTILINAIKSAIDSLLLILGTLTSFLIISSLIINHLHCSPYTETLIKGLLEITMGIKSLSLLNLPDLYKLTITVMFLSFGGLSVHLQVLSQLTDTDISYQPFFVARLLHALISGAFCFILYHLFF